MNNVLAVDVLEGGCDLNEVPFATHIIDHFHGVIQHSLQRLMPRKLHHYDLHSPRRKVILPDIEKVSHFRLTKNLVGGFKVKGKDAMRDHHVLVAHVQTVLFTTAIAFIFGAHFGRNLDASNYTQEDASKGSLSQKLVLLAIIFQANKGLAEGVWVGARAGREYGRLLFGWKELVLRPLPPTIKVNYLRHGCLVCEYVFNEGFENWQFVWRPYVEWIRWEKLVKWGRNAAVHGQPVLALPFNRHWLAMVYFFVT